MPDVTPEEMKLVFDRNDHNQDQSETAEVSEILSRFEQIMKERSLYMRDSTKEIITKMLPADQPLDMPIIMDILHVYYWWDNTDEEPANCITHFLRDLDDSRFAEAVEVLHEEFRDLCAESQELEEPICTSKSGMACLRRGIMYEADSGQRILAKPFLRAEQVSNMLIGLELSSYIFNEDMLGDDASELLDGDFDDDFADIPNRPKRPLHSLADMLSRHAVERLVEAGCDDIEAMGATYVIENEAELRSQTSEAADEYRKLRNSGVSFEQYVAEVLPAQYLQNDYILKSFTEAQYGDEVSVADLSTADKEAVINRGIGEIRDCLEAWENYYQLSEFGISPYYRRRFGEEMFPAADRI